MQWLQVRILRWTFPRWPTESMEKVPSLNPVCTNCTIHIRLLHSTQFGHIIYADWLHVQIEYNAPNKQYNNALLNTIIIAPWLLCLPFSMRLMMVVRMHNIHSVYYGKSHNNGVACGYKILANNDTKKANYCVQNAYGEWFSACMHSMSNESARVQLKQQQHQQKQMENKITTAAKPNRNFRFLVPLMGGREVGIVIS